MNDEFAIVDPADVPTESFVTCDVRHRKLTERLGCTDTRINQILLEPGEVTTPHSHDGQEEVFVAMTGGRIEIEGTVHDVPEGGVARVAPELARSLRNDSEERQVWIAVGAPPVGTVEDFGATIVDGEPME